MGLFSKSVYREQFQFDIVYPQKATQWGHSSVKKNYFDAVCTKKLIENKHEKAPNVDNMNDLIKRMNFFHTASFVPTKTPYCKNTKLIREEIVLKDVKEEIPEVEELLTTSRENRVLWDYYTLQRLLEDKSFNYEDKTFIDDEYLYEINSNLNEATIIKDLKPIPLTPLIPAEPTNPPEPISFPMVEIRKALGTKLWLYDIGVVADIDSYINQKSTDMLREEFKNKFNIDFYGADPFVYEEGLEIVIESKDEVNGTAKVKVYANYTWDNYVISEEERWAIERSYPKNMRFFFFVASTTYLRDPTLLEPRIRRNMFYKLQKWELVKIFFDVPLSWIKLDEEMDKEKDLVVEYKDSEGKKKLGLIKNYKKTVVKEVPLDIEFTASLPIKGGVPSPSDKKAYKYWRLALERAGYKQPFKRNYGKKGKPSSLYSSINDNGNVSHAYVTQRINLLPIFNKANRNGKFWGNYVREIFKFLDKMYGGFTSTITKYPEYGCSVAWYEQSLSGVPYNYMNKLSGIPKYRVRALKRYVNRSEMKEECFIGIEPNENTLFLYYNLKDFSNSSEEEKSKGIYYGYWQYALDLKYWCGGYPTKREDKRRRRRLGSSFRHHVQYLSEPREILLEIDLEEFKAQNGYEWFNDNSYITPEKYSKTIEYEYERWTIEWRENTQHHSRLVSYSPPFKNFYFDDRIDYTDTFAYEAGRTSHLPIMPHRLWLKVPYSSKTRVAHTTIFLSYLVFWYEKESTFLGNVLGFVMVIVGAVLSVIPATSAFGASLIKAGVVTQIGITLQGSGPIGQLISMGLSIWSGWTSIQSGIANGGFSGMLTTASGVVGITNSVYGTYMGITAEKALRENQAYINKMAEMTKETSDKLLEESLKGVDLSKYDAQVTQDEDIDMMYYILYGGIMYNDFYDSLAYNTPYKIYENYDRFKK